MARLLPALACLSLALAAPAQTLNLDGLRAAIARNELTLTWQGERGEELRAGFAVHDAQPAIREFAIYKPGAFTQPVMLK